MRLLIIGYLDPRVFNFCPMPWNISPCPVSVDKEAWAWPITLSILTTELSIMLRSLRRFALLDPDCACKTIALQEHTQQMASKREVDSQRN